MIELNIEVNAKNVIYFKKTLERMIKQINSGKTENCESDKNSDFHYQVKIFKDSLK